MGSIDWLISYWYYCLSTNDCPLLFITSRKCLRLYHCASVYSFRNSCSWELKKTWHTAHLVKRLPVVLIQNDKKNTVKTNIRKVLLQLYNIWSSICNSPAHQGRVICLWCKYQLWCSSDSRKMLLQASTDRFDFQYQSIFLCTGWDFAWSHCSMVTFPYSIHLKSPQYIRIWENKWCYHTIFCIPGSDISFSLLICIQELDFYQKRMLFVL